MTDKNLDAVNLRGPSKIVLENFICDICGKRRSIGNYRNLHAKCSKIKQARYFANNGK